MLKSPITATIILLYTASSAAISAECPVSIGETALYVEPKNIYDELRAFDLVKSEYETGREFEARIEQATSQEVATIPHLLRATYFPGGVGDNLSYNAEQEEFVIKQWAWDNLGVNWDSVFGPYGIYDGEMLDESPWGIRIPRFALVRGVGLIEDQRVTGNYTASNALGATVQVTEVERDVYAVFEEHLREGREEWVCELARSESETCSVRVSVDRENAQNFENGMSVGIVAKPKFPLAVTGTVEEMPTIQYPINEKHHYKVIVADILCAVLSGPDGRIAKVIEATP